MMKNLKKGTEVRNYRPIACLNLIWKPLTGIISDQTYDDLEENKLLPEEKKKEVEESAKGLKINLRIDAYCKIAGQEKQM